MNDKFFEYCRIFCFGFEFGILHAQLYFSLIAIKEEHQTRKLRWQCFIRM